MDTNNSLPPCRWNELKRRRKEVGSSESSREEVDRQTEWHDNMSNGCTAVPDFNFRHCCVEHDKGYYYGGGLFDRWKADWALKRCIRDAGHPILCWVYFLGVRFFGRFLFAWGIFGWLHPKGDDDGTKGSD